MIDLLRECIGVVEDMRAEYKLHGQITNASARYLIRVKPRLDAALAGKDAEQNAAPQPSIAEKSTAPSQEGVGQGEVASAAPGLPEEPESLAAGSISRRWVCNEELGPFVEEEDYDALRTFALLAVKERDEAWAAVKPFAALRQPHQDSIHSQSPIFGINGANITKADLDAAAAAIAAAKGKK